jgi:hypothetical protein
MRVSDLRLDSNGKGMGRNEPKHVFQRLFDVPEVVLLLAFKPEVRCRTRETSEADSHVGTNRRCAGENPVERLTGDAKLPRSLTDG